MIAIFAGKGYENSGGVKLKSVLFLSFSAAS
jgi:hypothetical protein